MDSREAWDELYRKQPRAWRGSLKVPDLGLPKKSNVLDVGCGNGKTSSALIDLGFSVTGLDYSKNAINSCEERLGNKAHFIISDCWHMPFYDDHLDGIYAVHLTEHLDDYELENFSNECYRILRSKGKIFVRSFSPEDMRSNNNIRNEISYHYRTPNEIAKCFENFYVEETKLVNDKTKFGTMRSRSECIFTKL